MQKYRTRCALPSPPFKGKCIHPRLKILAKVQWLPKWTKLAVDSKDVNLKMYWYDEKEIPENWSDWMPEYRKEHCKLLLKDRPSSDIVAQERVIDLTQSSSIQL